MSGPLTVIVDNASVHTTKAITPLMALHKQRGLTLFFLKSSGNVATFTSLIFEGHLFGPAHDGRGNHKHTQRGR